MSNEIGTFKLAMPPSEPDWAHVYAFEMSDGTTKIGISHDVNKRTKSVSSTTKCGVLRVFQTKPAPLDYIREIEKACHARFATSRVRGEFFNITFEAACAELALYEPDIAEMEYRVKVARFNEAWNYFKGTCEYRQLHAVCEKLNEYSKARGEYDGLEEYDLVPEEVTADLWWRMYEALADDAAGIRYRRLSPLISPGMLKVMECDDIICRTIEDGMAAGKSSGEIYEDCKKALNVNE